MNAKFSFTMPEHKSHTLGEKGFSTERGVSDIMVKNKSIFMVYISRVELKMSHGRRVEKKKIRRPAGHISIFE